MLKAVKVPQLATYTLTLLMLVTNSLAVAAAKDVKGSKDHPLLGRFKDTYISWHKVWDFEEMPYIFGPSNNGKIEKIKQLEGKLTTNVYRPSGNPPSYAEVIRNYELQLKNKGFTIDFKCDAEKGECANNWDSQIHFANSIKRPRNDPNAVYSDYASYRYLAASKKSDNGGNVYATVYMSKEWIFVSVLEEAAMENKMINASDMEKSINETGRVALYGIYFDTNKSTLKAESSATIDEIAKLLKKEKDLKLAVVGHTDNQGDIDYNMKLSKERAKAVVDALVKKHGINANRLKHWGVGFLSPVATNRTEDGRAKNRRVELVEQ